MIQDFLKFRTRPGMLFLVYLLMGGAIYANSLYNGFHYDDQVYIVKNGGVHSLSNLPEIFTSGKYNTWDPHANAHYRPLVTASYLLNYVVGGLNPLGYHLVNLFLHILSAFLAAAVLIRLSGDSRIGALGGMIFLIHPLNAEAVNYFTARSSQMYAAFFLLSFYAYTRFRPPDIGEREVTPASREGRPRMFYGGVAFAAFVGALLSKEMALSLPPLLFLYEWIFRDRRGWRGALKAGLIPAVYALAVIIPYLILRSHAIGTMLPKSFSRDLSTQLATQSVAVMQSLLLYVVPFPLTIDHPVTIYSSFAAWPVVGCLLAWAGIGMLILPWGRSVDPVKRRSAFLSAWFFVALAVIVIYPLNAPLQENRLYLAGVGPIGILALGAIGLWDRVRRRSAGGGGWVPAVVMGTLVLAGAYTFQRNTVWKNDLTLWSDAVSKNPASVVSLDNLGVAYGRAGQWETAVEQYRQSLTINPNNPIATFNIGFAAKELGRLDEAEVWYRRAIRLDPRFFLAHYNLGILQERRGRWEGAIEAFRAAGSLRPDDLPTRLHRADALVQVRKPEEAAALYETILNKRGATPKMVAEVRGKLAAIRGGNGG